MTNSHDATIAARGGWAPEFQTPPSTPPIYMTTAFDLEDLAQLEAVAGGQTPGYLYTRDANPNHEAFAADVAALEGAESGVTCASGMGALSAVLMSLLKAGDHVIAGRVLYGRTGQLLNHLAQRFGLLVTFVDLGDPGQVAAAITPQTRLCIAESVTNPLVEVTDLPTLRDQLGAIPLLVDNTFATPCLLKPIEHGATLIWHSASKYLNGHGDVMLGVIAGPHDLVRKIRGMSSLLGVNSNPLESWLGSRGLRTLPLRMRQVSESAFAVARMLQDEGLAERVYYPGLEAHPSHAVATRLLKHGYGGMLAFEVPQGRAGVDAFFRGIAATIPFSPTLADTRTTLSYPTGTSHKFMTAQEREVCGIRDGLVRLSIGLEDAGDLCTELRRALTPLQR